MSPKRIDMLKLGFTLPNIANRILHSSTSPKIIIFNQEDECFDDYIREWLTRGHSILSTRYEKTGSWTVKRSSRMCRTTNGIDSSQLYPSSMITDMPTGVYTNGSGLKTQDCFILKGTKNQPGMHCFEVLSEAEPILFFFRLNSTKNNKNESVYL